MPYLTYVSYASLAAATHIGIRRPAVNWHDVISKYSGNGGDWWRIRRCQGKDKKRTQATRADDERI